MEAHNWLANPMHLFDFKSRNQRILELIGIVVTVYITKYHNTIISIMFS